MTDHMKYLPGMQDIGDDIMSKVLNLRENYDENSYTKTDVFNALNKKIRTIEDFGALLSPAAGNFLEEIARVSQAETRAHFGNNISLFTPLYIANYCDNHCIYCGFNVKNKIERAKLSEEEIRNEMKEIKKSGLEDILILTGESQSTTSLEYIGNACKIAKEYFKIVCIEIYPLNVDEYAYLHSCGVDFVIVFQETYNPDKYAKLHLAGHKRIFPYRLNAQERAVMGGMRGVGFAALLGLDDFRKDAFATGIHAYLIQQKYPYAEVAFSVPRLRPIINNARINPRDVHEKELLQVIMAYRLFIPSANITISTRELAKFRDNAIKIGANKISAGVSVGIGGHTHKKGDEQFEISDNRSVSEVCEAIRNDGLSPLMSEYIYV
ncbi:2-iminoacetate synthase ThiH [Campylobacter hominis]|uniref:Thiazole biosynthesis protein ThiH n=1 Tax=Campylobacter hominis (strain ATCC BAA-381 / DSM 21671 / CCUG 45161 / LMG 19568 / NCTC 13146 / CH001A) TaxID=360107 RepID=A7I2J0_CAMHC|nr:2-iminoacetate synthase ThiH [Campylobacter hominis]ABS51543.1 thiazole biosynthesis protein ThiH [Campylobacter hominis ATCC BAA-381]UAK86018.1 2-iminoacetate synthase ThiH [Campylobacter hominis]SUW85250.1 thiamine biosynthesis protein ThiH [Campylobacter hominis]